MKRRFYNGAALASTRELYHPGSAYGIRELEQHFAVNEAGESVVVRRVGHYYAAARLEGLAFKEEHVGAKTVERYEARADRLCQRSVTYGRVAAADVGVRQLPPAAARRLCGCASSAARDNCCVGSSNGTPRGGGAEWEQVLCSGVLFTRRGCLFMPRGVLRALSGYARAVNRTRARARRWTSRCRSSR